MMFGKGYVGVAPGTTMMNVGCAPGLHGNCPPDPFWAVVQEPLKLPWGPEQQGLPSSTAPRAGVMMPYANEAELQGFRRVGFGDVTPGPFGMTWLGFAGVMALAIAGGVGLGYISLRR